MNGRHRIKSDSLSWQQVDDEVVVLDLDRSAYLALNGSAAVLWHGLAERPEDGVDDDELVARLVGTYGIPAERARVDVEQFLHESMSLGLVE